MSAIKASEADENDMSTDNAVVVSDVTEFSFSNVFAALHPRRKRIFFSATCAAVVATLVVFLVPAEYTSEAVILTPQQAQSSLSTIAQLAGAGPGNGFSGLSLLTGFGLRNPSDLYVGILESRTIADALIARFHLKQVYGDRYVQTARKHLKWHTTIKAGRDTLIHIKVSDRSPGRAAQLANAYIDELSKRNSTVALTEASQRRLFFEEQLAKEKEVLADTEVALRNTQQFTGLVAPTGQAEALIRSASQLHAEILSRKAQLEGMKAYITSGNPRFQMVQRELATLRGELAGLERGEHPPGTPEVPLKSLPQAGLEYIRKYRDLKYHEALFEALSKQYEAARLDEARSGSLIQIIDQATASEKRSWPPRVVIILATTMLVTIAAALWTLFESNPGVGKRISV